jgi:hypothetical protein
MGNCLLAEPRMAPHIQLPHSCEKDEPSVQINYRFISAQHCTQPARGGRTMQAANKALSLIQLLTANDKANGVAADQSFGGFCHWSSGQV